MKKWIIMAAAMFMLGSMTACSATKTEETTAHVAANPEGLTPEKVAAQKETVERKGQVGAPVYEMEFYYYGNDDLTGLVKEFEDVEALSQEDMLAKLIKNDILPDDCQILSFEMEGEAGQSGPGVEASAEGNHIGTLDLSVLPELEDKAYEKVVIWSIVNTFTENYELDGLKLLVNGKTYSSEQFPMADGDCFEYLEKFKKF